MNINSPEKGSSEIQNVKRVAFVSLKAGCLTFIIAAVAIAIGFYLDYRLETLPRWTLIFLVGSAPFSLGGVYLIVRRALRQMRAGRDEEAQLLDEVD